MEKKDFALEKKEPLDGDFEDEPIDDTGDDNLTKLMQGLEGTGIKMQLHLKDKYSFDFNEPPIYIEHFNPFECSQEQNLMAINRERTINTNTITGNNSGIKNLTTNDELMVNDGPFLSRRTTNNKKRSTRTYKEIFDEMDQLYKEL